MKEFPPIYLSANLGTREAVYDVVRAAEWLLERWPPEFSSTPLHRAARIACLEALEEKGDLLDVRAALIAAAEEAGIFEGDVPEITRREPSLRKRRR
jgi:hypothetical protein